MISLLRASRVARPVFPSIRTFTTSTLLRQEQTTSPISFNDVSIKQQEPKNIVSPFTAGSSHSKISEAVQQYILYCNFTKNNTHLTLTAATEDLNYEAKNPQATYTEQVLYYYKLPQKVKISLSTGQLGFRKSARGEYEASFQTSAKMFALIKERGYLDADLQLVIKNFGKGREAFFDALKGKEGTDVRAKIKRLSDNTKLKFGGTRSPSVRRL